MEHKITNLSQIETDLISGGFYWLLMDAAIWTGSFIAKKTMDGLLNTSMEYLAPTDDIQAQEKQKAIMMKAAAVIAVGVCGGNLMSDLIKITTSTCYNAAYNYIFASKNDKDL